MGLLDRFQDISPLSRNFYGGAAGASYRRQEEAYGRALRQLRRKARRGDTNAALAEVRARESAMDKGFMTGGIRSADDRLASSRGFAQGLEERAAARQQAADLFRQRNQEELDALRAEGRGRDAADPGVDPGFRPLGEPATPRLDAQRLDRPLDQPATPRLDAQNLDAPMAEVRTPGLDYQRSRGLGLDRDAATPFERFVLGGGANLLGGPAAQRRVEMMSGEMSGETRGWRSDGTYGPMGDEMIPQYLGRRRRRPTGDGMDNEDDELESLLGSRLGASMARRGY